MLISNFTAEPCFDTDPSPASPTSLCLTFGGVCVALLMVTLVLVTIVGNVLVVESVVVYKRMRTFTNFLLVSLASADFLVGVVIMPLAIVDQLHDHRWILGRPMCQLWVSADVLLCTASILNLGAISLDRYFAITNPLKYARLRSGKLAAAVVACVWLLSLVICSPPLLIPEWHFKLRPDECGYATALSYRLYSSLGSFYIPLLVMLFVYYKIFRVANSREEALNIGRRDNGKGGSFALRIWKKGRSSANNSIRVAGAAPLRSLQLSTMTLAKVDTKNILVDAVSCEPLPRGSIVDKNGSGDYFARTLLRRGISLSGSRQSIDSESWDYLRPNASLGCGAGNSTCGGGISPTSLCSSVALPNNNDRNVEQSLRQHKHVRIMEVDDDDDRRRRSITAHRLTQALPMLGRAAREYFTAIGSSKSFCSTSDSLRNTASLDGGSKKNNDTAEGTPNSAANTPNSTNKRAMRNREKMIYLKERKALKTIGVVVCGFVFCWLPFFVLYLIEALCHCPTCTAENNDNNRTLIDANVRVNLESDKFSIAPSRNFCTIPPILSDLFLWLGYSNSVLNPFVYTFYNNDFRRCFKDLLTCGCLRRSVDRRMSVRRLHQSRF